MQYNKRNFLNFIDMFKFRRIIKFVKKYRKMGIASFSIVTTSDTIVLTVKNEDIHEQIRINY